MDHDNESDIDEVEFVQAHFPINLNLPRGDFSDLDTAAEAIRREFRDSAKWKRLRCRNVRVVSESETGSVYELEIGHAVEFDWTWRGRNRFPPAVAEGI